MIELRCGRVDEAIAALRSARLRLPGNPSVIGNLTVALLAKGRRAEAIKAISGLEPDDYNRPTFEAIVATDRAASDRALAELIRLYGESAQYQIAQVHAQRNEPELAFTAIARAWELGDPGLTNLKTDLLLAPLRADGRFAQWLHKIGFP